MASLSMASVILRFSPPRSSSPKFPTHGSVQFARFSSSSLASTHCISGLRAVLPQKISTVVSQNPQRLRSLTVFAHKGYKMKTHKSNGEGEDSEEEIRKQHLLAKKNNKRKLRLSKMHEVSRSDYDNVIGALPYLKVNRKAT
ncbi:hypothetical protein Bca52824_045967 [Brassica carinata]|uniref:50S ribosomal protein L35 n=1 Tax=Brassica carinata TaxID=52824 RepID=A0A8X7REJ9_BRACI|nr:hypothetical protein Bca52824_045967 [Brassica carinata]